MHPLDNPIWHALTSEQARFARAHGAAACFPGEVTALAGLREPTAAACRDLAALLAPGERTGLFLSAPLDAGDALAIVDGDELLQMVHAGPPPADEADGELVGLGEADVPAMRALAEQTRPGPFGARTHELGDFIGVRDGATLAAMTGQRLRLPGLIELSAICTAPAHGGRGLARRLTRVMTARVRAAGATPFLHVRASNRRAIDVYADAGYVTRRVVRYAVVVAR